MLQAWSNKRRGERGILGGKKRGGKTNWKKGDLRVEKREMEVWKQAVYVRKSNRAERQKKS